MIVGPGREVQPEAALTWKGNSTLIAIDARAIPPVSEIATFVETEGHLRVFCRKIEKEPT